MDEYSVSLVASMPYATTICSDPLVRPTSKGGTAQGWRLLTILTGIHSGPPSERETGEPGQGGSPRPIRYRRAVDAYQIYDGTDENGIVGTVAPGLFAQGGSVLADGMRTQWAMGRTVCSR
jgi:hypothetical protein